MEPEAGGWREPTPGAALCTPRRGRARRRIWRSVLVAELVHGLLQGRLGCAGQQERQGASLTAGAEGVELLVRCRRCGHRGHAKEVSAK